jgi:hypothetical protein
MDKIDIKATFPSGADRGDPLTVTVQYDFYALTPLISTIWGGGALSLESSATMYIE